jgi:hypothetical protein
MCYSVPTAGAVITTMVWWRTKSVKAWWLSLLFWGGALFGVIDHLWNGELFLISENIVSDLWLGVAISAAILVCWVAMVFASKTNPTLASYTKVQT